jgi:hypothetical protein
MSQAYYRVDHTAATSPKVVGYEAMTDINTGTGPFPTSSQSSGGLVMQTSRTADSTPRWWTIIASQNIAYILMNQVDNTTLGNNIFFYCFGAFNSYMANDAYNNFISNQMPSIVTSINTTISNHFCPRSYTQTGSSVAVGKHGDVAKSASALTLGGGGNIYPNPVDGSMIISPVYLHEINIIRGVFPGLWFPCHFIPLVTNDIIIGTGPLSGKTLEVFSIYSNGQCFIETSNTW